MAMQSTTSTTRAPMALTNPLRACKTTQVLTTVSYDPSTFNLRACEFSDCRSRSSVEGRTIIKSLQIQGWDMRMRPS